MSCQCWCPFWREFLAGLLGNEEEGFRLLFGGIRQQNFYLLGLWGGGIFQTSYFSVRVRGGSGESFLLWGGVFIVQRGRIGGMLSRHTSLRGVEGEFGVVFCWSRGMF